MENMRIENNPLQDFERRKTRYFSDFAMSHLSAFRPHYKEGKTLGRGLDVWRNVSEHCLVAGVFADILADKLHLESGKKNSIIKAMIMHDWFKKQEFSTQGVMAEKGNLSLKMLEEIKTRDKQLLQEMEVPENIIDLTGANVPKTSDGPKDFSEKIVWYVDAMLSNTEPVPIRQRFSNLEKGWDGVKEDPARAERNKAFSDLYKERYDGKSLYEVQQKIGDKLSVEFSEIIGFQGKPEELPILLKEELEQRINEYQ